MYQAFFDGSSKGNPGPCSIGYTILDDEGRVVIDDSEQVSEQNTNNFAEYTALIKLLEKLIELKVDSVLIQGDSLLVVNQVNGKWVVNPGHLKDLHRIAKRLIRQIRDYKLEHVRRGKNKLADILAQSA